MVSMRSGRVGAGLEGKEKQVGDQREERHRLTTILHLFVMIMMTLMIEDTYIAF